jgi:hypothetical protein
MTIKELYEVAEQSWDDCDGCTKQAKEMWVSGFVAAAFRFADIKSLPSPNELEELSQKMAEKFKKIVDIPPDYNQLITDNFEDLV